MTTQTPAVRQRSPIGLAIVVVGILLIIGGAGVAVYEKYVRHETFHLLAFHPLADGLAILGLIVLIVGAVLMQRH